MQHGARPADDTGYPKGTPCELVDMGISKKESSQSQAVADIGEEKIEEWKEKHETDECKNSYHLLQKRNSITPNVADLRKLSIFGIYSRLQDDNCE